MISRVMLIHDNKRKSITCGLSNAKKNLKKNLMLKIVFNLKLMTY